MSGRVVGLGANGDVLQEGKLDLPELRETPTADEYDVARRFISGRRWQDAVTYRDTAPHEYTVRSWRPAALDQRDFEQFAAMIRRFGYADFYYRLRHLYWVIDDQKYWTMGWPLDVTTVINRARVDALEPWRAT